VILIVGISEYPFLIHLLSLLGVDRERARAFSFLMCPNLVGQDLSWRDLPGQVLAYEIAGNALRERDDHARDGSRFDNHRGLVQRGSLHHDRRA
jgi:hypothetical protein